jgi:O-antigen/teichoic acid export membrane protein
MIPVYLDAFGLAAYGLIGFYISVSSLFVLLDFGMGYASIKLLSESSCGTRVRDIAVLKLAEKIYLGFAALIGLFVYFLAGVIAEYWLKVDVEGANAVVTIQLMALLLFVSWPQSLYQSFLVGQERFVAMNAVMVVTHILVSTMIVLGLANYDLGVNYYFVVMAAVMLLQTIVFRRLAWERFKGLPIVLATIKDVKRFFSYAAGVSIFSLCSLAFFQGPLLMLSALSTTSELGLYNLAMTFPMAFITLMYPVGSVFLPKFANIVEDDNALQKFEYATLLLGSFITAGITTLLFNMEWIYSFWLGEGSVPAGLGAVSKALAAGTFCYGIGMVMTSVLVINGQTKLLSATYVIALLWYCLRIYTITEPVSALSIANLWKEISFIVMFGILVVGLIKFPSLFKGWFRNTALVLFLGLVGALFIWILLSNNEGGSLLHLILTILILGALYARSLYKVAKAL